MARTAGQAAGTRRTATRNMAATPHKSSSMKLALNDDAGEKAERRLQSRKALAEIQLTEMRGAPSPMRKLNQNKHTYARAASESPRTPRMSDYHSPAKRKVSGRTDPHRRHQNDDDEQETQDSQPGQRSFDINVSNSASAITPMKRVPILANFEEWMKMATDNKINAANSWNFALIDYFHDMSLLKEGDGVNFQKASCTLDGCVKIYTSRVDSVATETGRLLSGLADSAEGKGRKDREAGEEGEEGEEEDEEEGGKKKQKKKPARSHEATLAPSFASLQLKKLELEFVVDPLFKKASADFDEGGAKGLLLNHLSIDSEGRIVFDSSDDAGDATPEAQIAKDQSEQSQGEDAEGATAAEEHQPASEDSRSEEEAASTEIDLDALAQKFFPDISILDNQDICPSMKSFTLGSSDLTLPFLKAPDDWREKTKEPTPAPLFLDPNINLAEQSGIFLDDNDDGDIGGFDMNLPDNVGFGEGGEAWARDAAMEQQLRFAPAGQDLDNNLLENNESYAVSLDHRDRYLADQEEQEGLMEYFNKAFNSRAKVGTKGFVTLENWRIQKLQKARQSEGQGTTRTRKEKEPFEIDFTGPISDNLRDLLDAPPVSNSQISLPKAQWRTKGRNLLDRDDEMVDVKKLMRLWIKPRCRVGKRKEGGYRVVDEGYGARGQKQTNLDSEAGNEEAVKGDYDANFFADDDQMLPFDVPLGIEDDGDDGLGDGLGMDGDEGFMDAREMLSPQPEEGQPFGSLDAAFGEADGAQPYDGSQPLDTQQDLPPGSFGSQLVTQQGRRLRPEYVNYARTAKKVDVRRLKENMWKGMADTLMKEIDANLAAEQQQQQQQQQQLKDADGDADMMDVDQDDQPKTPEDQGPVTPPTEMKFTEMIGDLQKVYPEQQMKDISTSYCFICLLHLANEKGLILEGEREEGTMQEIRVLRDPGCGVGYEGE